MPRILMISKPVAPPWNDSSKNLVRDLSAHLQRYRATVMTRSGAEQSLPRVRYEPLYSSSAGGFAPALADNARVLLRLLAGSRHDLWHFFFAPNPRTSAMGRLCSGARRVPTVQTVCSTPALGSDLRRLLFADRTVVLSRHSERRMLEAGVPPERLRRIAPAVEALAAFEPQALARAREQLGLPVARKLVLYPGDLEYSSAAEQMLRAHARSLAKEGAVLVLACRAKTQAAHGRELDLRALAAELGVQDSVFWVGETRAIHALLALSDVVALPAETLYAKMDLPLVVIEAMLLGRCALVAQGTPAAELAEGGAAVAVAPQLDAVAERVAGLLADDVGRAQIGARARAAAQERFAPERMAVEYEALYDELLQ